MVSADPGTNMSAGSSTERPAAGGGRSGGADPHHPSRLCSHAEPPGPGAALLSHAHSLQHR